MILILILILIWHSAGRWQALSIGVVSNISGIVSSTIEIPPRFPSRVSVCSSSSSSRRSQQGYIRLPRGHGELDIEFVSSRKAYIPGGPHWSLVLAEGFSVNELGIYILIPLSSTSFVSICSTNSLTYKLLFPVYRYDILPCISSHSQCSSYNLTVWWYHFPDPLFLSAYISVLLSASASASASSSSSSSSPSSFSCSTSLMAKQPLNQPGHRAGHINLRPLLSSEQHIHTFRSIALELDLSGGSASICHACLTRLRGGFEETRERRRDVREG